VIAKNSSFLNQNILAIIFVGNDSIEELYSFVLELKNLLDDAILFSMSDNSVCNCKKFWFAFRSG
jgi:hypothetical protein